MNVPYLKSGVFVEPFWTAAGTRQDEGFLPVWSYKTCLVISQSYHVSLCGATAQFANDNLQIDYGKTALAMGSRFYLLGKRKESYNLPNVRAQKLMSDFWFKKKCVCVSLRDGCR